MKRRKICILTQPLRRNYGGLLQAYALQKVLKDLGHDVVTDERPIKLYSWHNQLITLFFSLGGKILLKYPCFANKLPLSSYEIKQVEKNTNDFIQKNISHIDFFKEQISPAQSKINQFDAFVVGSDQVWREEYSYIPNYFLDFTTGKKDIKRIAYAASFGIEEWTYSKELTEQCSDLAKSFDLITVREDSAVALCNTYLGVKAEHVLDPTMLLSKEEYISLVKKDQIPISPGKLMVYILDRSANKTAIVKKIASILNIQPFFLMPELGLKKENRTRMEKVIYPKVTTWLRAFMDAEYVVTDSFHGTVFAIIFNKPFISIANSERGLTRFISLLKLFSLEGRLISEKDISFEDIVKDTIDYKAINNRLELLKKHSIEMISNQL